MMEPKTPARLDGEYPIDLDATAFPTAVFDILGCAMDYSCKKLWSQLVPTADPTVRTCLDCNSPVTLCADQKSLERAANGGQCVAFLSRGGDSDRMTVGLPSSDKLRAFLDDL
jgi:hypothetical protein